MKKILFIMLLMAISLSVSCNNANKTIERTVSFNISGCKMYYGETEITSGGTKIEIPIASPYYVKFSVKANEDNYKKPSGVTLDKVTDYAFYKEYGDLYINLQSDIAVTGTCDMYKTLEECAWAGISAASKDGIADKAFAVGQTKTVMVNNQPHKVRIIGFNQDVDKDGNDIGITFEFANLISDERGYSIATQWNDTNDIDETTGTANHDYMNSSLRRALNGEGGGHILWAQYSGESETTWSKTYTKSVLDMLPNDLTKVLVAPKKSVMCNDGSGWEPVEIKNEVTGEFDKLFLLAPEEMGYSPTNSSAYSYYEDCIEDKEQERVKKQIIGNILLDPISAIKYDPMSIQEYESIVFNSAGYNLSEDEIAGGMYWTRDPFTERNDEAYGCSHIGWINTSAKVYNMAIAVAPAFCI